MPKPVPYVLIVRCFSIRFRDQLSAKIQLFLKTQVISIKIQQKMSPIEQKELFLYSLIGLPVSVTRDKQILKFEINN